MVVVEWCALLVSLVEVIASVESVVPEIFEELAVEFVGAALSHDVDDGAGIATVLGLEVGEDLHFSNGADGKNG